MKAPSASKAQGGKQAQHGVEHQALCQTLDLGDGTWTHGDTGHSGVATAGGPAGTCLLSPYLSSRKEAEGGTQQVQAAEP